MYPQQGATPWAGSAFPPTAPMFPEGPTGLPAEMLDTVPGYDWGGVGDNGQKYIPPPPYPMGNPESPQYPIAQQWSLPSISEDAAREALVKYSADHATYSSRPAREMTIQNLKSFSTYKYQLESFTESRSHERKTEPYDGQVVDNFGFAPTPMPWDIMVDIPEMFVKNKKKMQVPHSSSVKPCHQCMATGRLPCTKCVGTGRENCFVCSGKGTQFGEEERCHHCMGNGIVSCNTCSGFGQTTCNVCDGKAQLLHYIQLTIKWKNNPFEKIIAQESAFPEDRFKKATGQKLFTDQQYQVYPVMGFPDPQITVVSQNAIREHQERFGKESRIVQQRHTVEFIPLTQVNFQWKGKEESYFVYGTENRVYAPKYPGKSCSIM